MAVSADTSGDCLTEARRELNEHRAWASDAIERIIESMRAIDARLSAVERVQTRLLEAASMLASGHAEAGEAVDSLRAEVAASRVADLALIGKVANLAGRTDDMLATHLGFDPEQIRRDAERPTLSVVSDADQ